MTKPARFTTHVYDATNHTADTPCPEKWFWCRIHWITRFSDNQEKWYEPYPLSINWKDPHDNWHNVQVYCGPGTFYPKAVTNRSYAKGKS